METPRVFMFGSPIWLCCIPQQGGADSFGGPLVFANYPDLSVIALFVNHLNFMGLVITLDNCTSLCTEKVAEEKFMKGLLRNVCCFSSFLWYRLQPSLLPRWPDCLLMRATQDGKRWISRWLMRRWQTSLWWVSFACFKSRMLGAWAPGPFPSRIDDGSLVTSVCSWYPSVPDSWQCRSLYLNCTQSVQLMATLTGETWACRAALPECFSPPCFFV